MIDETPLIVEESVIEETAKRNPNYYYKFVAMRVHQYKRWFK